VCPPEKSLPRPKTGEVSFSLAKMTEGADVSDNTNLSFTVVGATFTVARGT